MKNFKSQMARLAQSKAAVAGGLALVGLSAHADPAVYSVDTSSIVAVIAGGVTTVSAIGLAVLSLVVVVKMFKWIQRVL